MSRTDAREPIRAAVVGGTGYGASELFRLSLLHPSLRIVRATSSKQAGRPVADAHPFLRSVVDLAFEEADPAAAGQGVDVVFLALPHGPSAEFAAGLVRAHPDVRIVDLSGDFRLTDGEVHRAHYPHTPVHPELRLSFVYGLPELFRAEVARARRVANPGCFATGSILALAPLAAGGLLEGPVAVDGKTGSSGSGAEPTAKTHHPERVGRLAAYSPLEHRHAPEIEQALRRLGGSPRLAFVPHSTPMVRGIYTTAYVPNASGIDAAGVLDLYRSHYAGERFVRVLDEPPDAAVVAGGNFCDVWATASPDYVVAVSAIDNLVKGAAGQAIQNVNAMFGLEESTGLLHPGSRP